MKQVNDLLFQTWCEAIVIDKKKQDRNMISFSVLPTLTVIVDLLLASKSDLDNKFMDYILNSFPLELLPMSTNGADKIEKCSVNGLNLDICLLVLRQKSNENINRVLDYIKSKFSIKSKSQVILARNVKVFKLRFHWYVHILEFQINALVRLLILEGCVY